MYKEVRRLRKLKAQDYRRYCIELEKLHSKYTINEWISIYYKTLQEDNMSTRAVIRIYDFNDDCVAKYYVYHDGYPEAHGLGLGMELYELFRDIKRKRFKLINAKEAIARIEWGIPRAERLKDWEVITDIRYMYDIFLKDKEIQVSQVYYDRRKREYTAPIVNWVKDVWKFKREYNRFISQHR